MLGYIGVAMMLIALGMGIDQHLNKTVVHAQSNQIVSITVNGRTIIPKNGVINIETFDPTQVMIDGNNLVFRNYTPAARQPASTPAH